MCVCVCALGMLLLILHMVVVIQKDSMISARNKSTKAQTLIAVANEGSDVL